jgi:hypothetical protein
MPLAYVRGLRLRVVDVLGENGLNRLGLWLLAKPPVAKLKHRLNNMVVNHVYGLAEEETAKQLAASHSCATTPYTTSDATPYSGTDSW